MQYDAITLGNHEFDDKSVGLVPFVKALEVPLVVANLDFSNQPDLAELKIKKSTVVERGGVKIGIIGYLTPETAFLSSPENVVFQVSASLTRIPCKNASRSTTRELPIC